MLSKRLSELRNEIAAKKEYERTTKEKELLAELDIIDRLNLKLLHESLAVSSNVCPQCGRPL